MAAKSVPNCTMSPQELTEWCWAAVTKTLEALRSNDVEQCTIAAKVMPDLQCCDDKLSCNSPQGFTEVLAANDLPCHAVGGTVEFSRITDEIDGNRPVACHIQFSGGTSHVILISGYDGNHLAILDPGIAHPMPPRDQPYDDFLIAYRTTGTWDDTYFLGG